MLIKKANLINRRLKIQKQRKGVTAEKAVGRFAASPRCAQKRNCGLSASLPNANSLTIFDFLICDFENG